MERKSKKETIFQKIIKILNTNISTPSYNKYFFESLATMLAAGIDIRTILKDLRNEAKKKNEIELIDRISIAIENGTPIYRVIRDEKLVAPHYLSLIKIGELSGSLPENLNTIVKQIDRDRDFNNKIRSASLYPSLVFSVLFLVVIGLMTFVFPKILGVYKSLNIELPSITKVMISIGDFFSLNASWFIPLIILIIFLIVFFLFINKSTKKFGQRLMFKFPGIKNLLLELELSRFGYLMNSLIKSGIPLPESLNLIVESTQLYDYQMLYKYIAIYIEKGYSMDVILESYKNINKLFPLYPKQLIINGVRTRKLEENFLKIGELYEKKNELTLKDIGTLFEPALLILIWIGVSIFAISVIMPMYSILGNLTDITGGSNQNIVVDTVIPTDVINNIDDVK